MSGRHSFDELRAQTPERQERIADMERQIRTAMRLRELRLQQHVTQKEMAVRMRMTQRNVSKLEQGGDPRLSSIQRYVTAMGGTVRIVVDLPNEEPIDIVTTAENKAPRTRNVAYAGSR
jgi:transcriptional regulator with XRE-family HTH domain